MRAPLETREVSLRETSHGACEAPTPPQNRSSHECKIPAHTLRTDAHGALQSVADEGLCACRHVCIEFPRVPVQKHFLGGPVWSAALQRVQDGGVKSRAPLSYGSFSENEPICTELIFGIYPVT